MEELSVLACPSEPPRDGGLTGAEDSFGGGRIQPFGQRREHHGDLLGRGFQTIQRRVTSSAEGAATGLAAKGLDRLSTAMLAVPDQRMDVSVCVAKVRALWVRTGKALGVHPLGCSPPAFHLRPGTRHLRALILHPTKA